MKTGLVNDALRNQTPYIYANTGTAANRLTTRYAGWTFDHSKQPYAQGRALRAAQ